MVSDLRQSRRLDGGGAAQSRLALRAVVARSPCHKHLGSQSVPCPSSVAATLPSPGLSEHSKAVALLPHFGADHSLRSWFRVQNYHLNALKIFPEPSNCGSLPGKAGGFPVHLRCFIERAGALGKISIARPSNHAAHLPSSVLHSLSPLVLTMARFVAAGP